MRKPVRKVNFAKSYSHHYNRDYLFLYSKAWNITNSEVKDLICSKYNIPEDVANRAVFTSTHEEISNFSTYGRRGYRYRWVLRVDWDRKNKKNVKTETKANVNFNSVEAVVAHLKKLSGATKVLLSYN